MQITAIETILVNACEYTNWTLVHVETDEGLDGIGEATVVGSETLLQAAVAELAATLRGADPTRLVALTKLQPAAPGGRIHYAAVSAIEQALWDIAGKALGVPVARLLGGALSNRIPLYANINRGTRDRTPAGFAESARQAAVEGFRGIKCAPFDGVQPGDTASREGRERIQRGIERVDAVRDAIGPERALMVDCHWRFTAAEAIGVARELARCDLYWLEDMVADGDVGLWLRFRQERPERVAGGERKVGLREFLPFVSAGAWDVVCPDVKWCGGLAELQRIAALADAASLLVAPHNPSGPVSTLASAHVCATLSNLTFLEFPWGECAWRSDLVEGAEAIVDGYLELPKAPGLGFRLSPELVAAHPYQSIVPLAARIGLPSI